MDPAPPVVEDLALGAFRLVKQGLGLELDFTPETLPLLDHYLAGRRAAEGGLADAESALVGPCAGAYFGEVVRRTLPEELVWRVPEDPHDYPGWRLAGAHVPLSFNPIGAALEALYAEALADWGAHIELPAEQRARAERVLAEVAPVRDEDYYRLTVRYEVLEEVVLLARRT